MTHHLQRPAWILLLALPVAAIEWLWGNVGLGGWNMLTYPLFFLYGALFFAQPAIRNSFRAAFVPALAMALLTTALLFVTVYGDGMVAFGDYPFGWQRLLHAVSGWSWVVALLGWAYRFCNRSNRFLRFANEAVLPFYILHQTVIILLGYWVQQLPSPITLQYSMLILLSFVAILVTYLGLIRPLPWLRHCFGMKAARQNNNI